MKEELVRHTTTPGQRLEAADLRNRWLAYGLRRGGVPFALTFIVGAISQAILRKLPLGVARRQVIIGALLAAASGALFGLVLGWFGFKMSVGRLPPER